MNPVKKLIVTADIHGSYQPWLTLKTLLNPQDQLAIAGDLFDTKYGKLSNADFKPEAIKKDLHAFNQRFYYVYGNCDIPSFFPGFEGQKIFRIFNKKILLYHGHHTPSPPADIDIIIQGHTHLCSLKKKGSQIFMNPGSIACPRNGLYTYGIIEAGSAGIVELQTGKKLVTINF